MYRVNKFSIPRFIYSVVLNVAVLCIALFVFKPFFEEIDDSHIAMLAEGAYGTKEFMLIYVNVVLGKLYYFLYSIMPGVRWHTVIQYFFIFYCYVTTTYVISKHKHGPLLSFLAVASTFYEMYVSLQYTKTAAFVTTAGILLLFEHVRNNVKINESLIEAYGKDEKDLKIEKTLFTFTGGIMIIYGSMLRFEACIIACIPLFFVGILELLRTKLISKYLKVFIPTAAIVIALFAANYFVYLSNADWNTFKRYNKARTQLTDYRYDILYYPDNGEKLSEMGITENDALMIVTYQFADTNIFDTEYLENISNTFGRKPFTIKVLRMLWGSIREEIGKYSVELPGLLCLIILLIATIISERSRSHSLSILDSNRKLYTMIFIGIFSAAALVYFQYSGRWSHRLVGALFVPAIFAICYMLDGGLEFDENSSIKFAGNYKDHSMEIIIVSLIIVFGFNAYNYLINTADYYKNQKDYSLAKAELKHISENKDNLFVFDTFTFQYSFVYDVFTPNTEGELSNFVSSGSWFMNSPVTKKQCSAFSYENPYDALINNRGDAYLIDNCYPDEKALFLTEHYGKKYNAVNVNRENGFDYYVMETESD